MANYDFTKHHIQLGDTDYPEKHNAAMDAVADLGNDMISYKADVAESLVTVLDASKEESEGLKAEIITHKSNAESAALAAQSAVNIAENKVMTKSECDSLRFNELQHRNCAGFNSPDFSTMYEFSQEDGWQNKFKLLANKVTIDGVWHSFDEQVITLNEAPNALRKSDLSGFHADFSTAILSGGTNLTDSYLDQREIVIAVQSDVELDAINALSTEYIQDHKNNVYSDDGVLRQKALEIIVELLPDSVPCATRHDKWTDTINAMTALGWAESNVKGQWEKDDLKAVAICWVHRRNQGAGHIFNPEGCSLWGDETGSGIGLPWTDTTTYDKASSFAAVYQYAHSDHGKIGSTSGMANNSGMFYDAIYDPDVNHLAMDVTPISNEDLLNDLLNKAVSNELRGYESLPFTEVVGTFVWNAVDEEEDETQGIYFDSSFTTSMSPEDFEVGDILTIIQSGSRTSAQKVVVHTVSSYVSWSGYGSEKWYSLTPDVTYRVLRHTYPGKQASAELYYIDLFGGVDDIAEYAKRMGQEGFYGEFRSGYLGTFGYNVSTRAPKYLSSILSGVGGEAKASNSVALSSHTFYNYQALTVTGGYSSQGFIDVLSYPIHTTATAETSQLPWLTYHNIMAIHSPIRNQGGVLAQGLIGWFPVTRDGNSTANYIITDNQLVGYLTSGEILKDLGSLLITDWNGESHTINSAKVTHDPIAEYHLGVSRGVKLVPILTVSGGIRGLQILFKEYESEEDDAAFLIEDHNSITMDGDNQNTAYGFHLHVSNRLQG